MTLMHTVQKGASDLSFIIGRGMMYGGGAGLFVMAVVGTFAVDLVLLAWANKNKQFFVTGFILGSMFSRGNVDPLPLIVASPITSLVAAALSVALGVPSVGTAILIGWCIAAALVGIGYGLDKLSRAIDPDPVEDNYSSSLCCC